MVEMRWEEFPSVELSQREVATLHRHEHSVLPLGAPDCLDRVENQLARSLKSNRPGPKPSHHTR